MGKLEKIWLIRAVGGRKGSLTSQWELIPIMALLGVHSGEYACGQM